MHGLRPNGRGLGHSPRSARSLEGALWCSPPQYLAFVASMASRPQSRGPSRSDLPPRRPPTLSGSESSPDRNRPPPSAFRRTRRPSSNDNTSPQRRRRSGARGYGLPREEKPITKIDLLFCVFHGSGSHSWRTAPYDFDRRRINDRELWEDIRGIYRDELQRPWRRLLLFKKLKLIAPIEYTANEVPIRRNEKDFPDKHSYMHAYHHPDRIHPAHDWVDFFTDLKEDGRGKRKAVGLEFVEGLWAEKLAGLAILITIAIIVASAVWCAYGGQLQTVFTVMSFVLGGATGESCVRRYFSPLWFSLARKDQDGKLKPLKQLKLPFLHFTIKSQCQEINPANFAAMLRPLRMTRHQSLGLPMRITYRKSHWLSRSLNPDPSH